MSVRGAVMDVAFAHGALPPIDTALVVSWGRPAPLVLKVHSYVDMEVTAAARNQMERQFTTLQATEWLVRQEEMTAEIIELAAGEVATRARRT